MSLINKRFRFAIVALTPIAESEQGRDKIDENSYRNDTCSEIARRILTYSVQSGSPADKRQ